MPRKPKHPCGYTGCPELTDGQYCEEHKRQSDMEYNRYQRDPELSRLYGHKWRMIRKKYMSAHPLCELCLKENRVTRSEECHHKKSLRLGGTHAEENLMALCKECHSRITAKEGNRWG